VAAAGLPPLVLLAGIPQVLSACLAAVWGAAYVAIRSDIIVSFLSQGTLFVVRAVGVMVLLDYVRFVCVAKSLWVRLCKQLVRPNHEPDTMSFGWRVASHLCGIEKSKWIN